MTDDNIPQECPVCGSWETTREWVDHHRREIKVVRVCDDCPTQYVVTYFNPLITDTEVFDDE